jgi:hypothetical protein
MLRYNLYWGLALKLDDTLRIAARICKEFGMKLSGDDMTSLH